MNLFLLGRPGGGKSTVASLIIQRLEGLVPVFHGDDFPILHQMYLRDEEEVYFQPSIAGQPEKGFNVKDVFNSPVLDIALQKLEEQTRKRIEENIQNGKKELVLLELARRNYSESLAQFSPEFLANSRIILIESSIETSKQRIRKRAEENGQAFIGDEIIEGYYGLDNYPLLNGTSVEGNPVFCIWNEGLTRQELREQINEYVEGNVLPHFGKEGRFIGLGKEL